MADKDEKNKDPKGEERFDPKPVQVGGESIVDRLLPHRNKILGIIAAGFAVYGVIAIFIHFRDAKREKHTEELAAVLDIANRPVKQAGMPETGAEPGAKVKPFDTETDRANAVISELAKQGPEVGGAAYRASQLVNAGKLDDAITEYRKAQREPGLDGVLAREGLGLALEMKATAKGVDAATGQKGLEEALATFKTMQPDDKGPGAAYAHYHQGRILVELGKKDEAKAEFQKAKDISKDKEPELAELIDQRLAMLGA